MAKSCPGTTYAKLTWLETWHIRDETGARLQNPFADCWGDGTTSSSDGQYFRPGSKAVSTGHINLKYGSSGRAFYTYIFD